MSDEMFFSNDERGLVRGRRVAARTETCRPCLIHLSGGQRLQGVILNLNPHGLLVRVTAPIAIGAPVEVQLMRDDAFSEPLAPPRYGIVVRHDTTDGTFYDLAVRLANPKIPKTPERRVPLERTKAPPPAPSTRMHTLDLTLGDTGARRTRR